MIGKLFSSFLNYFNNDKVPPIDSTPTLIASDFGDKVFGLSYNIKSDLYRYNFYYNLLPFKVKDIVSAGVTGDKFICYWTTDDELLFSGYMSERCDNYFFKYNVPKDKVYINGNMNKLFEFKWKIFLQNKLIQKINNYNKNLIKIKQVYALDSNYIIIELNNDILFYYNIKIISYDIIPINNVKWIKGGVMSNKVYIYTNFNELYTFQQEQIEKVNLDFLQKTNKSIRLVATTNRCIDALVTEEDNKVYIKSYPTITYGIVHNSTNEFDYRETPFERISKIIDIKGGFNHFIVLLENKKVYAIGYNNLGQLGFNSTNVVRTYSFNQIILKTRENVLFDRIYATSGGTVLRTDKEFIFLGEVISGFKKVQMIPDIKYSYILKREEGNRKWNEICCGPWSYLVYYKEKDNDTKDFINYLQNLKKAFNFEKNLTHDIEFKF